MSDKSVRFGSVSYVPSDDVNEFQKLVMDLDDYTKLCQEQIKPSGTKFDQQKPDLSLIPYSALQTEAAAFGYGVGKYGRYNYMLGFDSHRLVSAALRHVYAWQSGEDNDPETGINHLGHARACLAMLIETMERGTSIDTRYKK